MGLKNFLEDYIEIKVDKEFLKFKTLSVDDMFKLLIEERRFITYLFEGVVDDDKKALNDPQDFTNHIMAKYPTVIIAIIAICYVEEDDEKMSYEEKKIAIKNIDVNTQLVIFKNISEKTFKGGVFKSIKKTEDVIAQIRDQYGLVKKS